MSEALRDRHVSYEAKQDDTTVPGDHHCKQHQLNPQARPGRSRGRSAPALILYCQKGKPPRSHRTDSFSSMSMAHQQLWHYCQGRNMLKVVSNKTSLLEETASVQQFTLQPCSRPRAQSSWQQKARLSHTLPLVRGLLTSMLPSSLITASSPVLQRKRKGTWQQLHS